MTYGPFPVAGAVVSSDAEVLVKVAEVVVVVAAAAVVVIRLVVVLVDV